MSDSGHALLRDSKVFTDGGLIERRALSNNVPAPTAASATLTAMAIFALAGLTIYILCQFMVARTVAHLLRLDATHTAEDLAAHLIQKLPDLDTAVTGRPPTDAEHASLGALQASKGPVNFLILDRQGIVWRNSASQTAAAAANAVNQRASLAKSVIGSGQTIVTGATRYDQPEHFATVYAPIIRRGQVTAVVEVGIDQTQRYSSYRAHATSIASTVGLVTGLAFAIPAMFAYILSLRVSRNNRQIRHFAASDTLTALPDRREFHTAIELALKHAEFGAKAGVMMIGIEGYGGIVERHGLDVGGELLKQFAARLKFNIRSGDIIARIGEEHFGIIQRLIRSSDDCDAMINRLRAILMEPYDIRGQEYRIGLNVGVALLPGNAIGPSAVMNAVESSLQQSCVKLPAPVNSLSTADAA